MLEGILQRPPGPKTSYLMIKEQFGISEAQKHLKISFRELSEKTLTLYGIKPGTR